MGKTASIKKGKEEMRLGYIVTTEGDKDLTHKQVREVRGTTVKLEWYDFGGRQEEFILEKHCDFVSHEETPEFTEARERSIAASKKAYETYGELGQSIYKRAK